MGTLLIPQTAGTSSSASEPQRVGEGESSAQLEAALPENAQVAVSSSSLSREPLIMLINRYPAMVAELRSDRRWHELLSDPTTFDLLDRMADEALAEAESGLALDLDELLS